MCVYIYICMYVVSVLCDFVRSLAVYTRMCLSLRITCALRLCVCAYIYIYTYCVNFYVDFVRSLAVYT